LRSWKSLDRVGMVGLGVRGSGYCGRPCVTCTESACHTLGAASRRELKWWRDNAHCWMAISFEDVWKTRIKDIHVDASGFGYGSTNGLWGLWKEEELDWIIAVKELESLRRQVCRLSVGARVRIATDNQVVFWSMKRGRSFCWEINNLLRRIGGDMMARNLDVEVFWVPSEENQADWISRCWSRPCLDTGFLGNLPSGSSGSRSGTSGTSGNHLGGFPTLG
jgi:hypothetical protein